MKKKNIIYILIIFFLIIFIIFYLKNLKEKDILKIEEVISDEPYKSNIMENVSYSSKDAKGNEYIVNAIQGEIDFDNAKAEYKNGILFLSLPKLEAEKPKRLIVK